MYVIKATYDGEVNECFLVEKTVWEKLGEQLRACESTEGTLHYIDDEHSVDFLDLYSRCEIVDEDPVEAVKTLVAKIESKNIFDQLMEFAANPAVTRYLHFQCTDWSGKFALTLSMRYLSTEILDGEFEVCAGEGIINGFSNIIYKGSGGSGHIKLFGKNITQKRFEDGDMLFHLTSTPDESHLFPAHREGPADDGSTREYFIPKPKPRAVTKFGALWVTVDEYKVMAQDAKICAYMPNRGPDTIKGKVCAAPATEGLDFSDPLNYRCYQCAHKCGTIRKFISA